MPLVEAARCARLNHDADLLVDALAELAACFPVYRSYLPERPTSTSMRRSPTPAGDVPT